jgi:hypothetical protein
MYNATVWSSEVDDRLLYIAVVHDGCSASDEEPTARRSDMLCLVDVYKLAAHRRDVRE